MTRPDHQRARRKLSPHSEAVAFRIWAHCDPIGWDCTHREVADAIGVSASSVSAVCNLKGWNQRLRANDDPQARAATAWRTRRGGASFLSSDAELDAIASRGSA